MSKKMKMSGVKGTLLKTKKVYNQCICSFLSKTFNYNRSCEAIGLTSCQTIK